MKILNLTLAGLLFVAGQSFAAEKELWYSKQQVSQGKQLFSQNCAACHGENAEATPDWKKTDTNGNYPPPPLNGTGHAWHHDLDLLRRTIREGGAKLGGQMPAFEGVLSTEEIDSAIAFFQSIWPDDLSKTLNSGGSKLFIIKNDDMESLVILQDLYPDGIVQRYTSADSNKDFFQYFVFSE